MNEFYELLGSACLVADSQGNKLSTEEINEIISTAGTNKHGYMDGRGVSSFVRSAILYFNNKGDQRTVDAIHNVTGY